MTTEQRLAKVGDDLEGALRAFAGMCAVYDMPEETVRAMGAFAETLGEVAAFARADTHDEMPGRVG